MTPVAGVLVTRKFPGYKDVPGVLYHYPTAEYERAMSRLVGQVVLYYEPKRGGSSPTSQGGGRSAFIGFGFVESLSVDADDPTHSFASLRYSLNFNRPVPLKETRIVGPALQTAVQLIAYDEAQRIIERGLSLAPSSDTRTGRVGLAEIPSLDEISQRPFEEVLRRSRIRDESFRFQVIELAYQGTCAFSGMRQTNGLGRAEVDAAHIMPVASNGPDVIRNGIALSKTMHWAFDRGLISLTDNGEILTVSRGLDPKLIGLLPASRTAILPKAENLRPHVSFVRWHRERVFKGAA